MKIFGIKRLLLTTLIMILVMLAGLSTATFAWFSANNRVSAGRISFEARTADVTNLAIGWDVTSTEKSIEFIVPEAIGPMIPTSAPTVNTTTYRAFYESFKTSSIDSATRTFNAIPDIVRPCKLSGERAGTISDTFYVINRNETDSVIVSILSSIDGFNQPRLRVAVFVNDEFVRVLMSNPDEGSHYGDIVSGANADAFNTFGANASYEMIIPAGEHVSVQLLAWYDGVLLEDDHGGQIANFAVTFTGRTVK